jgi:WD40 repeat protein
LTRFLAWKENGNLLSGVLSMTEQSPAEAIFFSALEKGTPEERAAYLDAACGEDSSLRRRVERLLEAHPKAGGFLEGPAAEPTAACVRGGEEAGVVIAERYKLLEQIGEGGMGVVWVADQLEPIRRRVALKVIKPGMDSRAVLARFEAERQALALMDHPHIAKVLDAGTTADGRPFFVMELVKGTPITQFCDARKLTARERLELFVPVCQAVQHAHQKGIIHRDLKPSNVLVALHDERPAPKVIDFGVAKAVGQQLTEKTIYTGFGALVGTPAYMAPEQAAFNALDVDTRADVYALGVLLYELLIGTPPFEPERLKKAALDEVLRLVREEEPPRPSNRLSTSLARASIAAVRQTDPDRLTRLMRGELDWIVMKALEKDRNRRYETATGFAADVQRYLAGEAVQAHPPSAGYRLRKFVRKHRGWLTTAAAFAGLLLAAASVSGWLAVEARRAEKTANEQRKEAIDQYHITQRTEWFLWGVLERAEIDRHETEHLANNLQVEADLAEHDVGIRLLRLCRTLKALPERHQPGRTINIPGKKLQDIDVPPMTTFTLSDHDDPRRQELREFVTAAILAGGQDRAPLLPPLRYGGDGHEGPDQICLSPDAQTILTLGRDFVARLWNTRTSAPIATLRKDGEQVVFCGFSPDGRTIYTDSPDGTIRLWEAGGKYRAKTEARPNRWPSVSRINFINDRFSTFFSDEKGSALLSANRVLMHAKAGMELWGPSLTGPPELWDSQNGRLIARLDRPDLSLADAEDFQFANGGRWIAAFSKPDNASRSKFAVWSSDDARLLGRFELPPGDMISRLLITPSGRLATISYRYRPDKENEWDDNSWRLRLWDSRSWRTEALSAQPVEPGYYNCLADDWIVGNTYRDKDCLVFRIDEPGRIHRLPCDSLSPPIGDRVHSSDGRVFDVRTWKQLQPPPGRKFHPDLARFAPDGRFLNLDSQVFNAQLTDTWTGKAIPRNFSQRYLPGFGMLAGMQSSGPQDYGVKDAAFKVIPPPARLDMPADLLELWAQVIVRGELGPQSEFISWDEPTWERKWQELAASPAPWSDFPFPGHVVADRLHWLRQEYDIASDADKPNLAKQLLTRAEAAGDKAEAARWRAIAGSKANPPKK